MLLPALLLFQLPVLPLSSPLAFPAGNERWSLMRSARPPSAGEEEECDAPACFQGPPRDATGHADRVPPGGGDSGGAAGGSWRGPGDTVAPGSPTGGGGSNGGGTPAGPTRGGGPSPGPKPGPVVGLGAVNSGGPSTPTLAMEVDDGWWLWWEYNKTEYVRPRGLAFWRVAATGDDAVEAWNKSIERARAELSTVFTAALADDDARVRAAACDALAKLGGAPVVPHLLRLLEDKSTEVRHHALLALGASGAREAVAPLISIARTGRLEGRSERITPIASAVAVAGLALGRRIAPEDGFDQRVDEAVLQSLALGTKAEHEALVSAAMIYQRLVPCADLDRIARKLAEDRDESPSVRCRAIEAHAVSDDPETLARLERFLASDRLDERRSAALALGGFLEPRALPLLQSAYATEKEPLTRGLLLVSIGRHGGVDAREFLLRALEQEGSAQRHWAALALGLVGRKDPESVIRKALRDGVAKEKSREVLGAWWLALGLARDEEARNLLRDALGSSVDAHQRMYAATALGMLGGNESANVLRERLVVEPSAQLRVACALALGQIGREDDAGAMLAVLEGVKDPALLGAASAAVAYHGSRAALERLTVRARDVEGPRLPRAAAIESLSMMLGRTQPYSFGAISRQANYTVFSDWVKGMLQVSL
ncbi:MAG: HEAT repeat domain-containing protein [Planctomycetes bacterium]|nr:HEAT repeat domain-containing protein [Planctomycetota bacterium]